MPENNILDWTRGDAPERTSDLLFSNTVISERGISILVVSLIFPHGGRPKSKSAIPRSQTAYPLLKWALGIPKSILKGRIDPERLEVLLFWLA